ncbi:ADP-forming succinate--CoA ligase subunit beta [Pseudomonadota bacterium]|nr:ADP-forming succinate--CoA ligase subunit beta [Pseudomonadota bacterium]|tara:strand:+ start:5381 stop:6532 length:1152 start_codon:yes stop_codon:yes gene_type:complete
MNLHEYQSKEIFARYGLPVSKGVVIKSLQEVSGACKKIGGKSWVAKAQVHAGGRGKSGGVKLCNSINEVRDFAEQWLGKSLITYQTDEHGQLVNSILIEELTDIKDEIYLSMVVDRTSQSVAIIASAEGGVNIEETAKNNPEKIISIFLKDPNISQLQIQKICLTLSLNKQQSEQMDDILKRLIKLFFECDLALLEINPLVIKTDEKLHCLDAKLNVDNNALFRQQELAKMHDQTQEDHREATAKQFDLSYVSLVGNIGCMVNGAGLAMGTMDTIKFFGGNPANFLDVGGTATQERVAQAFKLILDDPDVKVILVNIFGGIVRCDLIAEGIIAAINEVGVNVPVIVRLEGNNADLGSKILLESNIESLSSLEEAAKKSVELAQ